MTGYSCPVCGYDRLEHPPEDYYICPCCGTEFGYEDFADTFEERQERWVELRERWIDRGAPWFSPVTPPPPNWNAYRQLLRVAVAIQAEPTTTTADVVWAEVA
jgi:hypothetical protein